jgi:FKBP-type peptidyl-prolyl cis-trans isomerase
MRVRTGAIALLAASLALIAAAPPRPRGPVPLPGPSYQVLASGPAGGRQPTRADQVVIRYVGRLADGTIFSTSADGGAGTSTFPVRLVIPGFSALVQLMRPGDRWIFTLPAYLAYGRTGKRFVPGDATMKHDVPPDSRLTFDVELVAVEPAP